MSIAGYLVHYAVFRDAHHIFLYLIGDIAFVFLEVLMVTLIIHELLNRHKRSKRMERLNMVIGAFFSDIGTSLLRLMENPNLLEHERFTNLLMATFHLLEELVARTGHGALPESDVRHLAGDVDRVYGQVARFWLDYMKYLKANYPYLFSLAVRMNPFDRCASPVVV